MSFSQPEQISSSPPLPNMEVVDLISSAGDPVGTLETLMSEASVQESSDPVVVFNRGTRKRSAAEALLPSDPVSSSQEPLGNLVARNDKRVRRASLGPSTVSSDPDFVVEDDVAGNPVALPAPATGRVLAAVGSGDSVVLARAATPLLVMSNNVTLQHIKTFIGRSLGLLATPVSSNQNLFHKFETLTDQQLKYGGQAAVGAFGHCCYLTTRKRGQPPVVKLTEAGQNNDSPRTELLDGITGKIYIYHILARHKAELNPGGTLTMDRLRAVSQDKRDGSPVTIVHLCGHKWCMNENHLDIKSKRYNDEQYSCHRGLQSAGGSAEYLQVQKGYCKHAEKCWTIVYQGQFADEHPWAVA